MKRNSEKGSVILYILIAVVLLAALSYAVSRGSRSGTTNLTQEQTKIVANQIISFADTVAKSVQTLKLRGCDETEINFDNNFVGGYTNGSAPSDGSCDIFGLSGGKVNYLEPESSWIESPGTAEWTFSGQQRIDGAGSGTSGDLGIYLTYLNASICKAINDQLNITPDSGDYPVDGSTQMLTQFTGSYGGSAPMNNEDGGIQGRLNGCVYLSAETRYMYYHALIARD